MARFLGIDMGTNSIGWAIVELDDGRYTLIDRGVRIFQEGVKIEKGVESSKAAYRTKFRSARRNKYRRKLRKIETLKALSCYDYCPKLSEEELNDWRFKKIYPNNQALRHWWMTDNQETLEERLSKTKNPYYFRDLAASKKLDLSEESNRYAIGRAFYHMAQRRGFLSNRLEGTKESDGDVRKSISGINEAKGDKTLGQYFFDKYKRGEKIRDAYTHREEHYLDEFNRICDVQQLPEDLQKALVKAIFFQRPLRSQKGLVGNCVFEPKKKRCPVSRPEFEEYRMLCFINNIKIKTPDDGKLRELTKAEKDKIRSLFFRKKAYFDFEDIAKKLAPKGLYKYYKSRNKFPEDYLFNYSMGTMVSGCLTSSYFRAVFGAAFMDDNFQFVKDEKGNTPKKIVDAWHALFTFDSEKKLFEFAKKNLDLDEEQIASYVKISLKQDYASLSLKAINKILPYLRGGLIYSHAVFMANMEDCIPKDIWESQENREIIKNAIIDVIQTQNLEKQIVEVVNGLIANCKAEENNFYWSDEAADDFEKDLNKRLVASFGEKRYSLIPLTQQKQMQREAFDLFKKQMKKGNREFAKIQGIDDRIKQFLSDNFILDENKLEKLYHPAALDIFKAPQKDEQGNLLLNSPMVSSVRNPMAMRALHQLRKIINELIKEELLDASTKVNIEMARGLLNANERAGYKRWQSNRENKRKEYAKLAEEHLKRQPTEDEILKYQLWEEQNHKCLYTGKSIGVEGFLGANPRYDIEHTIPRSLSFDNSQVNKTLCDSRFNRDVKKTKIPSELINHSEILARVEHWKEEADNIDKQIKKKVLTAKMSVDKEAKDRAIQKRHQLSFERDYLRDKYRTFTLEEVQSGFKNSQLVDTGIITKYSRLYLKTLFTNVYTVKGNTVADFRKMWGLQDEYEEKERTNHIHHCIDAITIACMSKNQYEAMANFYHNWEEYYYAGTSQKPQFEKPWSTFTEDVKAIENELLVSHYTSNNLPKKAKRVLKKQGKIVRNGKGEKVYIKGDSARGSLHKETFYGAIAHDKSGKTKKDENDNVIPNYVVRKVLEKLKKTDLDQIVDEVVKAKIKQAVKDKIIVFSSSDASTNKICDDIWMNEEKRIPIKKVRVYQSVKDPLLIKRQRDVSKKGNYPYKESFLVVNDRNYLMGIFEGKDKKGKILRDSVILNNLEGVSLLKDSSRKNLSFNEKEELNKLLDNDNMRLTYILKQGMMVLLYKESPDEVWDLTKEQIKNRLYVIRGLDKDGIKLYFHNEARLTTDVIKRMNDKINTDYFESLALDLKQTQKILAEKGIKLKSEKDINPNAIKKEDVYKILGVNNIELISTKDIQPFIKTSKLTTPKGGDVIDKGADFPYVKFKPSNFNALVEGVDFKITPLGKIIQLKNH
ncbi:MAG: type II CRISPR RNA-guided endonuclease Cas9 [Bacteroidales bacterium]